MAERIRAFIALELSPQARAAVAGVLRKLQQGGFRNVRWVDPAGAHLTLKFLGAVPADLLGAVHEAMRRTAAAAAPVHLGLGPLGAFPSARAPRVVWLGVTGEVEALGRLQRGVEEAAAALGFPREARPFRPHITLGRVREGMPAGEGRRLGETLARLTPDPVSWRAEAVWLVRSHLTPQGAVYQHLASARLGPVLSDS